MFFCVLKESAEYYKNYFDCCDFICDFLSRIDVLPGKRNRPESKEIYFSMTGKMPDNPAFTASYTGARLAAKERGEKYNIKIEAD
jgi:hypothetical protein